MECSKAFDDEDESRTSIRERTQTGRPCGSSRFLDQVEQRVGRTLWPRPRGRRRNTEHRKRRKGQVAAKIPHVAISLDGVKTADNVYVGQYDDGDTKDPAPWLGTKRFVDVVTVTFCGDDANRPDDYAPFSIGALPVDAWQSVGTMLRDAGNDGGYPILHNRSRALFVAAWCIDRDSDPLPEPVCGGLAHP